MNKTLEYFLDNNLRYKVIDILVYLPDGSILKDPIYKNYEVIDADYEKRSDGIYCLINVKKIT